jgi:dTDP-4-amino-4,6-dideoxygalactose transaminase
MSGGEMKYIEQAFRENWIAPLGPNVNGFEEALSSYCGAKHAAALSSGTAAIHLALIMLGVQAGDEVLTSTFTFSATINPIIYQGAVPVLIDSETDTWNMDPDLLEKTIQDRRKQGKRPKAIIVVHLYGMPAKMDRIQDIADRYNIPLIEDAAEALGARYDGKALGTFGLMGVLSFNGNKIITTSGGGALISDEKKLIDQARFLATQARDKAVHYQHTQLGYNYRMSNILAGIGRGQMEALDSMVHRRREINTWYRQVLKEVPGLVFHTEPSEQYQSNFWLTCILLDPRKCGTDREGLRLALEKDNIESRPLWKPMHLQPVYSSFPAYVNGNSEKLFQDGLCLPSGSNLKEEDLARILDVLLREFRL